VRDQVVIQRPFLHDFATGKVDENGIVLHAAKLGGTDQAVGGAGKRRTNHQNVGRLQELVQPLRRSNPVYLLICPTMPVDGVYPHADAAHQQGFITDFAAPGGNITGFTNLESSMSSKLLALLKEVAPGVTRAALMFNPATAPDGGSYFLKPVQAAASDLNVTIVPTPVRDAAEIDGAMAAFHGEAGAGLIVAPDVFVLAHREQIIALAARGKIPAVYAYRFFAVSGGLMSYGTDLADLFHRAGPYVDRILKGTKPGELPVQQPTKFELVVNLKTAKSLGLTIPQTLVATADEVIE
jgi:putative tryptophan/tyrosine transport system substrate-binding protein